MGATAWPLPQNRFSRTQLRESSFCLRQEGPVVSQPVSTGKQRVSDTHVEETTVLIRRCLQGDGHAWQQIVQSEHRRVYGICYRFTGSSHDAEDMTQEVFFKVYRNLKTFDIERGSFQSWLITLTRNLLVDHFRRTRMEQVTNSLDAGWDEAGEMPTPIESLEGNETNPLDHSIRRELQTLVQKALLKVSPELREAVILRDLNDMDYKEIAEVLRIPEGTVKSRISRGRMELAQLLQRNKKQVM